MRKRRGFVDTSITNITFWLKIEKKEKKKIIDQDSTFFIDSSTTKVFLMYELNMHQF